ncbi:MAG TPA: sigma-54-dependent Fis family transcriptional regulator [Vicinamibacterales bacterium]|nr:sigma-54-dependent Fis family transcriptional regulator [Vicinamibacterales bacterium]
MTTKPSPPLAPGRLEPLHLAELVDFQPDQGIIRLHEQRMVLLSAAAMGLMRKELIDTLGFETARRLFLRFGYADGYHDAVSLRERSDWPKGLEGLRAGIALQRLEGIIRAEIVQLEHDPKSGRFHEKKLWHDSYIAEHHLNHYGKSSAPVCWSLVGYASGYTSACLGQEIYFEEHECLAQGAPQCTVIGKNAESWGDQLDALRDDFHGGSLGREIERLRDIVHRRLQEVDRRERLAATRERELNLLRERVARHAASRKFIAASSAMKDVLELAARVAPLDTTVLIYGESGTGKEFIVRMIHDQSPRAAGPFVSINCAALTETLLESELFGHVRGAFTGAVRDKAGLFEVASNGTLFLDEIGEVAATVQAKLLRALQEREIRRVGAERTIKVDARVVAATNRDLRAAVAAGSFREDLYFRLGAFVIAVPPLRERRGDIPLLVHDFVRRAAQRVKKDVHSVSPEAMTALMSHSWPGNVRELEHAIERAVIVARGETIRPRELPPEILQKPRQHALSDSFDLQEQERMMIERALEHFRGNRKDAANALKISSATLWRKMKQYGLFASPTASRDHGR